MVFKRKDRPIRWLFLLIALFLIGTSVVWVVFQGYTNSDRWVRSVLEVGS